VRVAGIVVCAWLAAISTAHAQPQPPVVAAQVQARPAPLENDAPLVLRPAPELRTVAVRVARVLGQRMDIAVDVGGPPPPEVVEAVPEGHVAIIAAEGMVRLVIGARGGRAFATDLEVRRAGSEASVRAIALAVESLRDAARAAPSVTPPPEVTSDIVQQDGTIQTRWRMVRPFEGRAHPWREIQRPPLARPTLFARFLAGVSGERGTALIGVGLGLGLCVEANCAVLEGDLPFSAQKTVASDGAIVTYRFVSFSIRMQWRPHRFGDIIPGATIGLVTRVGTVNLGDVEDRTETDLGVRGTLELAWRFVERFELVAEAGLDLSIDRAQFIRRARLATEAEVIFLEDRYTPWGMFSIRVRP
jgi:hypothetical protein